MPLAGRLRNHTAPSGVRNSSNHHACERRTNLRVLRGNAVGTPLAWPCQMERTGHWSQSGWRLWHTVAPKSIKPWVYWCMDLTQRPWGNKAWAC